jgi:hypothetical protein
MNLKSSKNYGFSSFCERWSHDVEWVEVSRVFDQQRLLVGELLKSMNSMVSSIA